jgi:hypothetical protein
MTFDERELVEANIGIMRAFVRLRQMLTAHADLARKLAGLEKRYDRKFKIVFDATGSPNCAAIAQFGVGRHP